MALVEGSNVSIAHLGIVAGMYDTLGIGNLIDQRIPKKRHHNISHGTAMKSLVINGLGFNERRLYLMPEFFDDVATERLLGDGTLPNHLNQYILGETLDAIAAYGPNRLFTDIVLQMMKVMHFDGQRLHHDTTSFCVSGQYNQDFGTRIIKIVKGHSKDHREDLNQFVVSIATNQHGIPLFMEPLSGNESDKKSLLRSIQAVRDNLKIDGKIHHMADSAFYTKDNIQKLGRQCYWISHVPASIGEVKDHLTSDVDWIPCADDRYKYVSYESSYGDIPQKWILFQSAERQKQSEKKFLSNVQKKLKGHQISLNKLCSKGYACERDAHMIIERWHAKHPRYLVEKMEVKHSNQKVSGGRGRPRKDEPLVDVYRIPCKIRLNEEIIAKELEQLGRFILASNDCDIEQETMLDYYKEQNVAERGFKFLKDKTFHAAEIYLKNENRVAALSMIMVVCLLVYTVAEWLFRNILKKNNATVRNQMNKPTDRPTMKRVFYLFRRVRQILEISDDGPVCRILNFNKELPPILRLLGPRFEKYYA